MRVLPRTICSFLLSGSVGLAGVETDVPYGPHPSQTYDWYPADVGGPAPLVVFQHGAHGQLDKTSVLTGMAGELLPMLTANGVAVAAIDNHPFPEFIYPTQIDDAALAIQHFREHASALSIDPDAIALWGWSSGATIGALVTYGDDRRDPNGVGAAAQSSRPQAFLNWRGQTNWLLMHPAYPGIMFAKPSLGDVDPAMLKEASGAEAVACVARSFTPPALSYFGVSETPPPLLDPHDVTLMKDLHAKLAAFADAADSKTLQSPSWPHVVLDDLVAQVEWLLQRFALPTAILDLQQATPGTLGPPALDVVGDMVAGGAYQVQFQAALAEPVTTFLIVGGSSSFANFLGGRLVPSPDLVIALSTDAAGAVAIGGSFPPSLPPTVAYLQAWHADPAGPAGFAASHGLRLSIP